VAEGVITKLRNINIGLLFSLPGVALLLFGFIVPLSLIVVFSIMPAKSFELMHTPTLENYNEVFGGTYVTSLLWSLLLAGLTTLLLLVICYPLAFAMAKIFRRGATLITLAIVLLLFVSENIRLFGWVLSLMKGGIIDGSLKQLGLGGLNDALYNIPIIVFGMSYVYLPFMLFPLVLGISMIPDQVREAANDLGASRWMIFRSIDLPLSSPGILIGSLLTFVLSVGAVAEAKILGGGKVIPITQEIESIFSYAQNWPLGSALSTALLVIIAGLITFTLAKLDLDQLFRK
jgi:spermidine/putrescine transport system permease protein